MSNEGVPPQATAPTVLPPGTIFRVLPDGRIATIQPHHLTDDTHDMSSYQTTVNPSQVPPGAVPQSVATGAPVWDNVNKPPPPPGSMGYGYPAPRAPYGSYGYDEERAQPVFDSQQSMAIPGRLEFIRKTYAILTVQLAVTTAIILAFVMVDSIRNYVQNNPGLLYSAIIISLVLVCALSCFRSLAESFPINILLLAGFTLCQAYLLGTISSFFNTTIVLQALAMTCAITGILTVYAWTTKSDITRWGTFLYVGLMVLMFGFIIRMFLPLSPLMDTIWACFGALLFAAYLVYDTFLIIHVIPPNAYITACLMLYLDVINMFMFILQIMGGLGRR